MSAFSPRSPEGQPPASDQTATSIFRLLRGSAAPRNVRTSGCDSHHDLCDDVSKRGIFMRGRVALACLCCALGLPWLARGQSNYAVVTGTVVDPQHLAIRGATVEFKSVDTGSIRRVSTNESGIFEAPALLPDDYEVTTSAAGFAPVKQSLHLDVGQRLAIQVQLALSGATQQIRVAAGVDVLRATDASVGEVVEPKSIQELPLNGRMLLDLVLTEIGRASCR